MCNVNTIMSDVNDTNRCKKNKLRDLILKSVCEDIYDAEKTMMVRNHMEW